MTTTRTAALGRPTRRAAVTIVGGLIITGAVLAPPAAAAPAEHVPAKGAPVSCEGVGKLVGTSGYLEQRETRTVDRHGRSHVLFTVATDRVRLADRNGRSYRLIGAGYDSVVYPGRAVTGPVLREDEEFRFVVAHRRQIVGAIRFRLHTSRDGTTSVHDASTCRLPHMS